jgi:hypothetical protein
MANLGNNKLSGGLEPLAEALPLRPADKPSKLVVLGLGGNALTGAIPAGLTALGMWHTQVGSSENNILDLSNNELEGAVPEEFYTLDAHLRLFLYVRSRPPSRVATLSTTLTMARPTVPTVAPM